MTREHRSILALFAVALGLRVAYAALFRAGDDITTLDLEYAKRIAAGLGWIGTPISPQSPGYPIVLAIFYLVGAKQLWIVGLLQAVVGALTVVTVYMIGRGFLVPLYAALAALWVAFSAHQLYYATVFHRDILSSFLLLVLILLITRPFREMMFGVIAGAVFALLIHVDPQWLLLFPILAVIILLYKSRSRPMNLQYFFLFAAATILLTIPWTIRNEIVYRQTLPIGLEADRFFRPARNLIHDQGQLMSTVEKQVRRSARTNRIGRNSYEFWRFARPNDTALPAFEAERIGSPIRPAWSLRHNLASAIGFGLLLPFFAAGLVAAVKRRQRQVLLIAATIIYYFLLRTYIGGSERARLPVEPLITLIAFYGVQVIVDAFRNRRIETTASAAGESAR